MGVMQQHIFIFYENLSLMFLTYILQGNLRRSNDDDHNSPQLHELALAFFWWYVMLDAINSKAGAIEICIVLSRVA